MGAPLAAGLVGALVLGLLSTPRPLQSSSAPVEPAPLAPLVERQKLRTLASDLARAGEAEAVETLRAVLAALGDEEAELARLAEGWERALASARPSGTSRAALASRLRRLLAPLVARLAEEEGARRTALARALLLLDSEEPAVRAALGHVQNPDGVWMTAEEARWDAGAREVERRTRAALAHDYDFEHGESTNPVLRAVAGAGRFVRAEGVELHATLEPAPLERILRQALRASELSRALLEARPRSRPRPRQWVVLGSRAQFRAALAESDARGGLEPGQRETIERLDLASYTDRRGFEVARWLDEATLAAVILLRLQEEWIPFESQPCLRVGHLNWVALRALGTGLPALAWQEPASGAAGRSSAALDEVAQRAFLWRVARRTLWGCRAWMARQAAAGRDAPWARAMLDQDGKIRDEPLLKTTLVCALLQQEGVLPELLRATRRAEDVPAAIAAALGEDLPALEERWRRWLLPERHGGLLQALGAAPAGAEAPKSHAAALLALNRARATALQQPELPAVTLEPELSRAAELHARYLTRNPTQKTRWPAIHEEYADAPGFTPEGALAGGRSLVAFAGDPEGAVRTWLGTFYHRLPLLNPGLFGVGIGVSEEVVVLDAGSLVLAPWRDHVVLWPAPDAIDVPRACVPELPSPVPGVELASLGHPVSVQLTFAQPAEAIALTLELFAGGVEGRPVAAHAIAPDAPLQPEHAPENAWGLIPTRWLEPRTRYTARARWSGLERVWSFTTGE